MPDDVQTSRPGLPPEPPVPTGPAGGPELEAAVQRLIAALLEIPVLRVLVQEELMKRDLGVSRPGAPTEPLEDLGLPGTASPGQGKTFADKLVELRSRR